MLRASVRVQRTSKLLAAARSRVQRLRAALVNTDDSLAVALAGQLGQALGVEVTPTCARPTEVPTKLPSCVLVQSSPSIPNLRTGGLAGEVVLTYFGADDLHVMPTTAGVRSALLAAGVRAEVHPAGGLRHGEGVRSVSLRVAKVADAYPPVPVIGYAPGPDTPKSASYLCQDSIEEAFELVSSPAEQAGLPRPASMGATPNRDERLPVLVMTEDRRLVSATTGEGRHPTDDGRGALDCKPDELDAPHGRGRVRPPERDHRRDGRQGRCGTRAGHLCRRRRH